ncbi:bifunctional phosphopantothenoylcysteine decarboxylase/phosphopantothenate--cysteine ligase CoaBC [Thermithiobacillus plumbiphilus]|uniref:Coenzyme A biosynthesis bifunctional protein CoaBC n=1 Tax=Thermithiobacillus plumbiphilus TaxID=1729899 RepID=A0ABU9D957_9PROT
MKDPLHGKRILLGVGGGIAAYKTPELCRRLREAGAEVQVVMTHAAREFVTPLALQAVSGRPVRGELFDPAAEAGMDHIALSRWADAILVAPATADLMARLAQGMADDLLSTLVLASPRRPLLAPAMNQQMWRHPATQRNAARLLADGVLLLGPAEGVQACSETGPGRMLEPLELVSLLRLHLAPKPLAGRHALVTAGPTWEAIDPARGITNRSSGRQGYAVAQALAEAGAAVTLVSGPTSLNPPTGVRVVRVESALEMRAAVLDRLPEMDILVATAAVADFRPAQKASRKLAKTALQGPLELCVNPDILAEVAAHAQRPKLVVGFAAQTHDALALGAAKHQAKGVDLIAINDVSQAGLGFGSEDNHLVLIDAGGTHDLGRADKLMLARALVSHITSLLSSPTLE